MDKDELDKFLKELSSLATANLPVAKSIINQIAMASFMYGLKKYKLIVHEVEKFIKKCEPQRKVAGLDLIDSIVRQSQKYLGVDDLYGPRFAKNLNTVVQQIFATCLSEDKSKVITVLNLWQRDNIFPPHRIAPLFTLIATHPDEPVNQVQADSPVRDTAPGEPFFGHSSYLHLQSAPNVATNGNHTSGSYSLMELANVATSIINSEPKTAYENVSQMTEKADGNTGFASASSTDYTNTNHQFTGKYLTSTPNEAPLEKTNCAPYNWNSPSSESYQLSDGEIPKRDTQLQAASPAESSHSSESQRPYDEASYEAEEEPFLERDQERNRASITRRQPVGRFPNNCHFIPNASRSRSRSRSPVRSIPQLKPVIHSTDNNGFPASEPAHLTIGSTTLWVGNLPETSTVTELRKLFTQYGKVIQLYEKRWSRCAYVCMDTRQNAVKAYLEIKRSAEYQANPLKINWAPGHGLKDHELKRFWNKLNGCSLIPYSFLDKNKVDLSAIAEGGEIDKSTVPEWFKEEGQTSQFNGMPRQAVKPYPRMVLPNEGTRSMCPFDYSSYYPMNPYMRPSVPYHFSMMPYQMTPYPPYPSMYHRPLARPGISFTGQWNPAHSSPAVLPGQDAWNSHHRAMAR